MQCSSELSSGILEHLLLGGQPFSRKFLDCPLALYPDFLQDSRSATGDPILLPFLESQG